MTLDEIFKIIDQIKPNEEFYNPETNKVLILNKKGGLTFSDGSNPFSIENKDLKFIKRERKIVKGQEKDSWDDVYDYLNSDKANFVSIDELEKNYTYDNAIPNKELLEKLYPSLLYSLNKKELELYHNAKILQIFTKEKINLDFKHNLLVTETGKVYQPKRNTVNYKKKEDDIAIDNKNIIFEFLGYLHDKFSHLIDDKYEDNKKIIHKGIGTDSSGNVNYPVFTEEMAKAFLCGQADIIKGEKGNYEIVLKNHNSGKYVLKETGELEYISFNDRLLKDHSYEKQQSLGFFFTADGYFDAALNQIKSYEKRFPKLYMFGNIFRNNESRGYHQGAIVKTLLAFSCECYLKSLLLEEGKDIGDLKKLSHGLVGLYSALDSDTIANVFEDMEKNGYKITKYISKHISYDDPELTNKFMLELAKVDEAFVDSRYCAENDKDINYSFLYKFAISLRNITKTKTKTQSMFDDGTHFKK